MGKVVVEGESEGLKLLCPRVRSVLGRWRLSSKVDRRVVRWAGEDSGME